MVSAIFFAERPSSGIAGWRCGWIAANVSEGTRPALLPAGPVPEWWNFKLVFIETPDGQRLAGRACSQYIILNAICTHQEQNAQHEFRVGAGFGDNRDE